MLAQPHAVRMRSQRWSEGSMALTSFVPHFALSLLLCCALQTCCLTFTWASISTWAYGKGWVSMQPS